MDDYQANRTRQKLVNVNSHIVAKCFQARAEYFVKRTLSSKYEVKDHWVRYEWQHRGSAHVHSVIWLKDALDISNPDDKSRKRYSRYGHTRVVH